MSKKINVAVLGATGSVGQRFVELLSNHPWFNLSELAASEKSAGLKYKDAANWIMTTPLPKKFGDKIVKACKPGLKSKLVFSALDASVAGEIEEEFAEAGYGVISNAKNHRFGKDVPLVIPEVNSNHLELIKKQSFKKGFIVTNPNCSTIGLVLALKPLEDKFGIESINVITLQALSGAGYPGIPSLDVIDNVLPFISNEENKIETEPLKILGKKVRGQIENAKIKISAQCNRVPVIDGHTECIQVKLRKKATPAEIISSWKNYTAEPQKFNLPSAPRKPIHYFEEEHYPQPKIHRNLEQGMGVAVGRLRECPLFDYKFVVLSHNTIRGAAGGTILIAELMKAKSMLDSL